MNTTPHTTLEARRELARVHRARLRRWRWVCLGLAALCSVWTLALAWSGPNPSAYPVIGVAAICLGCWVWTSHQLAVLSRAGL